ncbi:MAG: hypothetical protein D6757_00545 [Alphaproteobacteria bacterium]|nr:MAG: hypothetical protein D6757_00545 [Alphaproteobacteria bacterium]
MSFAVLVVVLASMALAGCGWFSKKKEDPIFANTPSGPKTEQLLKQVPKGLTPDRENVRHTRTPLLPPEARAATEPSDKND